MSAPNSAEKGLPDIGTYWTHGALKTDKPMVLEAYSTCARCGSLVNAPDRHEDWHRFVERSAS